MTSFYDYRSVSQIGRFEVEGAIQNDTSNIPRYSVDVRKTSKQKFE